MSICAAMEQRLDPHRYSSSEEQPPGVTHFGQDCRLPVNIRRKETIQPGEITSAGTRFIRQAEQELHEERRVVQAGKNCQKRK